MTGRTLVCRSVPCIKHGETYGATVFCIGQVKVLLHRSPISNLLQRNPVVQITVFPERVIQVGFTVEAVFGSATNRPLRRTDSTERRTSACEAVQCASCLFDVLPAGLILDKGDILFRDQVHRKQDSFDRCRGAVHYRRAGVQNAFDPVLIDPVYVDRQNL